jgi:HEPN domain-containing protein
MATPVDLARRLLGAAKDDEFAARSVLPIEGIANTIVGFHSQQAVEKSVKAVLSAKSIRFPFTHDLESLIELCESFEIEVPSTLNAAKTLTPFAVAERYGSDPPLNLDGDQALKWAAEAVAWARTFIEEADPPPTRPASSP